MTSSSHSPASSPSRLLDTLTSPRDIKKFTLDQLATLAAEIRREIIDTVTINGGHLASSLGVVELTLALHYVYDFEHDVIVWDVGHQCYAHKLLTGRRDRFSTLRLKGGISGYPSRAESPYDAFGTGHSATSISAALGAAVARDQLQQTHHAIALIGDGAMTGGMALEALSHAGHLNTNLLVILNDNEMSIARNVGALASHFNRLITGRRYKKYKRDFGSRLKPWLGERITHKIQRIEASIKGLITQGGLFTELGFNYIGPIDGHDLPTLIKFLTNIKELNGPILFHCRTRKGCGLSAAEADPATYHGVKPSPGIEVEVEGEGEAISPESGVPTKPAPAFTDVFADALHEEGRINDRIVAITAAMPSGTGLYKFQEAFPSRFFDVSICEQHAVTFAGGLAARGLRPVCAIYSTFFQRAYDQFVHDVCLQKLPVVFAIDRAGLVGPDSPTHTGMFDLTFMRAIPNITLLAPRDDIDLRQMLHWALEQPGPVAIRYPRAEAPSLGAENRPLLPQGQWLREGTSGVLLGVGPILCACLKAAAVLDTEGISLAVADARSIKPLDHALLDRAATLPAVYTVEENTVLGGFGSAVSEYYDLHGAVKPAFFHRIGMPDAFTPHATRNQQLVETGLSPSKIAATIRATLPALTPTRKSPNTASVASVKG